MPSTCAIPDPDVFYVTHRSRSLQAIGPKRIIRRLHNQRPALKPGFNGQHDHFIRAAA
jgi:hypothetical protein